MPRLFVFTAGNPNARQHVARSVAKVVPRDLVFGASPVEHHKALRAIERAGGAFWAWGATPGYRNIPNWLAMQVGDIVVCVFEARYRYVARVTGKDDNEALARAIWGIDEDGQTWQYMYFLSRPSEIDVPLAAAAGELHARYGGFTRISDTKLRQIEAQHGSIEAFVLARFGVDLTEVGLVSEADFDNAVQHLMTGPLDVLRETYARTEQVFLRQHLFPGHVAVCGVCGREFPVDLLVAAHIKRRADCDEDERRDYLRNVMPLCRFGCDELFERGYIGVVNGRVVVHETRRVVAPQAVTDYLATIEGRSCRFWQACQQYFEWHAQEHGLQP